MDTNCVKISVVLPIYNVEKYIPYTLESLKKQTYRNFEILLVDDGTQDNSVEIAEKILKDTDIAYKLIRQKNGGPGAARNTGAENSNGEWIYFLDTDDIIHEDTFRKMVEAAEEYDPDIVFSDFCHLNEYKDTVWELNEDSAKVFLSEEIQMAFLKRTAVILAPGTLYRKSFLNMNDLRFEKIPWSEDQQFVWRALSKINKAVYIRAPFYGYYQRDGSIMSAAPAKKMIDSYPKIKALPEYFENNPDISELIVPRWVLGCLHVASMRKNAEDWNSIWNEMEGRQCMKALLRFPSVKVKIVAFIGIVSNKLLFRVLR